MATACCCSWFSSRSPPRPWRSKRGYSQVSGVGSGGEEDELHQLQRSATVHLPPRCSYVKHDMLLALLISYATGTRGSSPDSLDRMQPAARTSYSWQDRTSAAISSSPSVKRRALELTDIKVIDPPSDLFESGTMGFEMIDVHSDEVIRFQSWEHVKAERVTELDETTGQSVRALSYCTVPQRQVDPPLVIRDPVRSLQNCATNS